MTTTTAPILELIDVSASYGRIEVLHEVSFQVPKGAVVAMLGPNGAGKSTTLKVASGQLAPSAGHLHLGGVHVNGASVERIARAGVCTIPEGRGIFPNLSVDENLRLCSYGDTGGNDVHEQAYARFPRLGERRRQLAGRLSGGEQQMLAMSRALTTNPALLMLDELSMGLAPQIVGSLYDVVVQIAEEGVSVLVIEQFARRALAVADYVVVLVNGRVTAVGEPADIADELSQAYLGGAA